MMTPEFFWQLVEIVSDLRMYDRIMYGDYQTDYIEELFLCVEAQGLLK